MKTVLKDLNTGLLFRNMDEWTSSLEDAASFRDTVSALKFCQHSNLHSVAIVHAYNNGNVSRVVGFHGHKGRSSKLAGQAGSLPSSPQTLTVTLKADRI
jgi:hypothetical protein